MSNNVNVGIIGLGAFMARQHLPNIMKIDGINIHTLCDLDEELLSQRKKEFAPQNCVTDCDEVFQNPDIDAVIVGTRSNCHAAMVEKAVKSGKHIYVEKPMAMTYEEINAIRELYKDSNVNIGVGFNRRFSPIMIEAKKLFQKHKGVPANIIYRIVDDHRIRPHYIFDMNDGGGHLLQEGCHIFDLLAWFLEEEPIEVYATGQLETDNCVTIKYSNGSTALLLCGGKGGLCYPKELMESFCNSRTIAVDSFFELRFDGPRENFIKTFPFGDDSSLSSMTDFYKATFDVRPEEDLVGPHAANHLKLPKVDKGHSQALAAFAQAIINKQPYSVTATDGARATVCALKAYESIKKNLPIPINFTEYNLNN